MVIHLRERALPFHRDCKMRRNTFSSPMEESFESSSRERSFSSLKRCRRFLNGSVFVHRSIGTCVRSEARREAMPRPVRSVCFRFSDSTVYQPYSRVRYRSSVRASPLHSFLDTIKWKSTGARCTSHDASRRHLALLASGTTNRGTLRIPPHPSGSSKVDCTNASRSGKE